MDPRTDPVPSKLLVVDDDEQILRQVRWALGDSYQVFTATDRTQAIDIVRHEGISLVLLDLGLPPSPREATEGLQALEDILALDQLAKVVIVSGNSERQNAVRAVEQGAYDIFPKPIDVEQLKIVLQRVEQRLGLEQEGMAARTERIHVGLEDLIGSSPEMREVFATVKKVAPTDVPVLITGESGTGKEEVAAAIHSLGNRKERPFVPINCGAIPANLIESELFGHEKGAFTGAVEERRGKLEYAHGGTLFLDEIGELDLALQVKILRFLQEKRLERVGGRKEISVDARVLAATNRNLQQAVAAGKFRDDLYFRLAVVTIRLPPLRDRGADVLQLAEHFADLYAKELGTRVRRLSQKATEAIRRHPWPGNVRELQNRIKRAVVLAEGATISPKDLQLDSASSAGANPSDLRTAKERLEQNIVAKAFERNRGNISKTARELGISRPTLYDLIERYGLRKGK